MAALGGIVPGFGCKRALAPQIVSHFGKHEMFYEPFVFTCSILFAKEPCRNEVVSEKNPDVANLIRCLADEEEAKFLWRQAETHCVSEDMFAAAVSELGRPFDGEPGPESWKNVRRAFDFLLVSWQGMSGLAGTTRKPKYAKRNTSSGGALAAKWRSVAPAIPEWHERLRNVEFRCADAFDLLAEVPDREGVVVYCDSPYFSSARTGGEYMFDFKPEDHERLACDLRRFHRTRVVVSHKRCTEADSLYHGWRLVQLKANKVLGQNGTSGGEVKTAEEVLYINESP